MKLNCPKISGQFKLLSRLEFFNQDFAGHVHYCNNDIKSSINPFLFYECFNHKSSQSEKKER